ncbi:MAG: glycosyltransferase family 4 protein, partial [Caldilineales bacterium]|nr:glycosyltransferase family 4 protein [Caldilineales bacterium]
AIVRDEMTEMAALLRRLAAEARFDVVHADQLSMASWGLLAAEAAAQRPRTVLDEHNAIYKLTERIADEATGLRRLVARREARAFRRYEAAMLRAYDAVLTVTDQDRCLLLDLFPEPERSRQSAKFTTIPICVDPARVAPVNHPPVHPSTDLPAYPTVLHLGTMFWPPNAAGVLWFAKEVLPLVWTRVPEARFVVVGKNPPAEVRALAADPRVQVAGYVPDPTPYLEAADVFIVPLFSGSGMRVKILDGWLWGLPIVSTPIGAEGIEVRDGENLLIAADAPAFADAVVRVLTDAALNRRLRTEGRRWVEARYDWRVVYPQVDAVYRRLLSRPLPSSLPR